MTIRVVSAVRVTMAQAVAAAINAGAAGKLRLYSAIAGRPATVGGVVGASTLLAELTFNDPVETSTTGGTITINISGVQDASADAGAPTNAEWFTIVDSTNAVVLDGTVTVTGGGGDFTMPSVAITAGLPVQLTGTNQLVVG